MTAELDALAPQPQQVTLRCGLAVELEDLRLRQFCKLLRIITHAAVPAMKDLFRLDPDIDPTQFAVTFLMVTLLSIPDAEDETIAFIQAMAKPVGLIERRDLNKADKARNDTLWATLDAQLDNPELDDSVTIIEAVVRRESNDIQALGKRLAAMFTFAAKTGQLTPDQTSPTSTSSAGSPDPSTSSPPNTDGPTTSSPGSPSNGSAKPSRRSANAAATPNVSASNG